MVRMKHPTNDAGRLILLQKAAAAGARMEFVQNDDPDAFLRDAATLKAWLANNKTQMNAEKR